MGDGFPISIRGGDKVDRGRARTIREFCCGIRTSRLYIRTAVKNSVDNQSRVGGTRWQFICRLCRSRSRFCTASVSQDSSKPCYTRVWWQCGGTYHVYMAVAHILCDERCGIWDASRNWLCTIFCCCIHTHMYTAVRVPRVRVSLWSAVRGAFMKRADNLS